MRVCGACKLEKPFSDFNKDKNKKLGIGYRCKSCSKISSSNWYKENKDIAKQAFKNRYKNKREEALVKAKEWRDANPAMKREANRRRKALLKSVKVSRYSEAEVIAIYGNKCHICKDFINMTAPRWSGKPGWEVGFQVDHLIPISKGGEDSLENVRPSHGKCNLIKSANVLE